MKKLRYLFIALLLFVCLVPVHAEEPYVVDELNELNREDVEELNTLAEQYSNQYGFGFYVHMLYDEDSYYDIESFAEDYYGDHNLGYNNVKEDGMLFLITQSSEGGSYDVYYPANWSEDIISLDGLNRITETAAQYLYDHDYYSAAKTFLEEASEVYGYYAENGEAWTYEPEEDDEDYGYIFDQIRQQEEEERLAREQREKNAQTTKTVVQFALPPILSLIIVLYLRSKNKTKRIALQANSYISRNSVHLRRERDMFLYHTVTRTPIHDDHHTRSGGGGGGAHFSSSGGMHSSGHF